MVDSEGATGNTQNYSNSGIIVPAGGGIVVATRGGYMGAAGRTFTWTGLTENSDADRATNYHTTTASQQFATAQNPLSIGVNCSGSISGGEAAFTAVCLQ